MSWFSLQNSSAEKDTRRKTNMSDDSLDSINEDFDACNHRIPESWKAAFIASKNDSVERPTKL